MIEALRLWDRQLDDDAVAALAARDDLCGLRVLELGWNRIGPRGAAALASSPVLANLERLDLYHNQVGDRGAAALAESPHLRLASINLCGNGLDADAAIALAGGGSRETLTRVHAGGNRLGDRGVAALARLPRLEELNVRLNGVGRDGAAAVAERSLRFLGIEDNPIGDGGLIALADGGALAACETAVLIDTHVTAAGIRRAAAAGLPADLRLGDNALGDAGVEALVDGLGPVRVLGLAFNDIGPDGAELLAGHGARLELIDLIGNPIGARGRLALRGRPVRIEEAL